MDDRQIQTIIKDSLQTNLIDPRISSGGSVRNWIHTDKPLNTATFPRVVVSKRGPTNIKIMSIGYEFWEQRVIVLDIEFWTDPEFKYTIGTETLKNEELVKYYQNIIQTTLKSKQETLHATYGITGFSVLTEDDPHQDPNNFKYIGSISVRFWYFRQ